MGPSGPRCPGRHEVVLPDRKAGLALRIMELGVQRPTDRKRADAGGVHGVGNTSGGKGQQSSAVASGGGNCALGWKRSSEGILPGPVHRLPIGRQCRAHNLGRCSVRSRQRHRRAEPGGGASCKGKTRNLPFYRELCMVSSRGASWTGLARGSARNWQRFCNGVALYGWIETIWRIQARSQTVCRVRVDYPFSRRLLRQQRHSGLGLHLGPPSQWLPCILWNFQPRLY